MLLISYGLLFFVTVQRIKTIEDVERLLRWCAISAMCMAVFGLVQYLGGNGKFFWFYSPPFANTLEGAKGSFTNRNHFAHFLALGVGPLIWWLLYAARGMRSGLHVSAHGHAHPPIAMNTAGAAPGAGAARIGAQTIASAGPDCHVPNAGKMGFSGSVPASPANELETYILGLALAVLLFAGLMSLSRGGIAALVIAALVAAAVCCMASSAAARFLGIMLVRAWSSAPRYPCSVWRT